MNVTDIFSQGEQFIVGWAGEKPEPVRYGGEIVVFPAHNEVAKAGPRSIYRYSSAVDREGKPIPGTVLIRDQDFMPDLAPGVESDDKRLTAAAWCKGVLTIRKNVVQRGLYVVREPEDVPAAREAARRRFEVEQDRWAEQTIRDEVAWKSKYEEKHGQAAPDSSNIEKVREATAWLLARPSRKTANFSRQELLSVIGQTEAPPKPMATPKLAEPEPAEDDPRLIGSALYERSEELGITLKKELLKGLLKGETAAMAQVEQLIGEAEEQATAPAAQSQAATV